MGITSQPRSAHCRARQASWLDHLSKGNRMTKYIALALAAVGLASCANDADVASRNISQAADNFEIARRVVFYNGITNDYMLEIQGFCSLGNASTGKNSVSVTCKTGPGIYKKHFLGLSDNVTFFAEQLDAAQASTSFYRVTFKPSVIIPAIDLR
jgi:hypothetical protein